MLDSNNEINGYIFQKVTEIAKTFREIRENGPKNNEYFGHLSQLANNTMMPYGSNRLKRQRQLTNNLQ